MTVSMPPPGRSRAARRSSPSGSPKCMKRPPLQVPTAVVVGSMLAPSLTREAVFVRQSGPRPQRRLQPPERVRERLLVDRLLSGGVAQRLRRHAGAKLLELVDAQRQVLAFFAPQLVNGRRQRGIELARGERGPSLVQVKAGAQ